MDELTKLALVGTSRTGNPSVASGTPVDDLVKKTGITDAERALLVQAGARAMYVAAGLQPSTRETIPAASPAETRPECSAQIAQHLAVLIAGSDEKLLISALKLLDQAGQRLPIDLLPDALNARTNAVRAAMRPVIGERGIWLAQFNDAWKWARSAAHTRQPQKATDAASTKHPKDVWETGNLDERLDVLADTRATNAAQAREWLADVWKSEKAETRAEMLARLETNLSPDDENFLVDALKDRSQNVRAVAGKLLLRLPGSAYATRSRERADAILDYDGKTAPAAKTAADGKKGGKAKKGKKAAEAAPESPFKLPAPTGTLTLKPPAKFEPAWNVDGLEEKAPAGVGNRAWWSLQLLSRVDPRHWEAKFKTTPEQIFASALATDDAEAICAGLAQAVHAFGTTHWMPAAWDACTAVLNSETAHVISDMYELLGEFFAKMPEADMTRRLMLALDSLDDSGDCPFVDLNHIVQALPSPWAADLAKKYLAALRNYLPRVGASRSYALGGLFQTLADAALGIPRECFAEAVGPWEILDADDSKFNWHQNYWRQEMQKFVDKIRTRQQLLEAFEL